VLPVQESVWRAAEFVNHRLPVLQGTQSRARIMSRLAKSRRLHVRAVRGDQIEVSQHVPELAALLLQSLPEQMAVCPPFLSVT